MTEQECKLAHARSKAEAARTDKEAAFKLGQREHCGPTFKFVPGETFGQLRAVLI